FAADDSLKIQLFFDEFETVNPLGSKTKGHKFGAIYMSLKNLPLYLNSKLNHIHLVALFNSVDLQNDTDIDSFNKYLKPIVDEIKILETTGIEIGGQIFKGSLAAMSFDNLGANTIYGMVQSFSATNFCRFCFATKTQTKTMICEDPSLIRTSRNCIINKDCNGEAVLPSGVKYECQLNELKYFNIFDCPGVDLMHDILEGVAPRDVKLFLKWLVGNTRITIETINDRLIAFNYGKNEMTNKPRPMNLDKPGCLLGERASQMWCLVRYLPFLISDYIEDELVQPKWALIKKLLQIMHIVFSPVISHGMKSELDLLIQEHHLILLNEYEVDLIPKDHNLIHYVSIIEKIGPLLPLWSMRFEAKHMYFIDLTRKYKNFKNITKTLAEQHQ
ncbi:GSCOCG00012434001-RA-CDS, partial [Cotesia congregata]